MKKKNTFSPKTQISVNHTLQNICLGAFGFFFVFYYLYKFVLFFENFKVYSDEEQKILCSLFKKKNVALPRTSHRLSLCQVVLPMRLF